MGDGLIWYWGKVQPCLIFLFVCVCMCVYTNHTYISVCTTNLTCTEYMYTYITDAHNFLLHVSALYRCHIQGVFTVVKVVRTRVYIYIYIYIYIYMCVCVCVCVCVSACARARCYFFCQMSVSGAARALLLFNCHASHFKRFSPANGNIYRNGVS